MLALTDIQRRFVEQLIFQGGTNHTRAYMIASGCSEAAANANAYRVYGNPKVQDAIRAEADRRLRAGALLGASVLIEIAANPMHKDQKAAAVELLNRSGLIVKTLHEVKVDNIHRADPEIVASINKIAAQLGVDAKALLGEKEQIEDAEYEEVVEPNMEGLEDV